MKVKTKRMSYDEVMALPRPKHKKPKRPNILFKTLLKLVSLPDLIATNFKCRRIGMKKLGKREPCLYLMNHSAFVDLQIVSKILWPKRYNIIMTSDGFVGKKLLMKSIGCIPTQKFVTDVTLIKDMTDFVRAKVVENKIVEESEVEATTAKIALAALKYGDLSNQPTKDYNFDLERFAAFEGNTGPYILYTIVRIKSILAKYGAWENLPIQVPANVYAKDLMLAITKFGPTLEQALQNAAPNQICAYIYELAGCVNKFYHETPILKEEDEKVKAGHIALIGLAKNVLETCISILGFSAPEKM